jgi:hypothetical protein
MIALLNVGMADAAIACWDSKYHFNLWRPITAIPNANLTGNTNIAQYPNWQPLGAPASNTPGPNFTPPFPTYPSGHGTFGGAIFTIMQNILGTDDIEFTIVSDEYNGKTKDADGNTRPLKPRAFTSLSQAMEENGQSRIYLGIHWNFDKTAAIAMGQNVATQVLNTIYT